MFNVYLFMSEYFINHPLQNLNHDIKLYNIVVFNRNYSYQCMPKNSDSSIYILKIRETLLVPHSFSDFTTTEMSSKKISDRIFPLVPKSRQN